MIIEIFTKDEFSYNEEKNLLKKINLPNLKKAKEGKLYLIEGPYNKKDFETITKEILMDKIVEDFSFTKRNFKEENTSFEIWFKENVTDVVSETLSTAIEGYGFKKPEKVRTGKIIYTFSKEKEKMLKIIKENFTNELIHKIIS